jgi:hypothetical protein
MSQAPTAPPPSRSPLVTLLGLLTLLWGLAIMAFFIYGIVRFEDFMNLVTRVANVATAQDPKAAEDAKEKIDQLLGMFRNMVNVVFGVFAFIGLIGFIGGIGVTFRIGRVLAFIFALINALLGGGALQKGLEAQKPMTEMILPIAILAYGVLMILVLPFCGRAFARQPTT